MEGILTKDSMRLNESGNHFTQGIDQYGDNLVAPGAGYCRRQRPLAAFAIFICQECPYLPIAEAGFVQAHIGAYDGYVDIKSTPELADAPIMVTP